MDDMILYEEKMHRGFKCSVYYDPDPMSPDDWDTLGTIYSGHRNYNPQKHKMEEIIEYDEDGNWHVNKDYLYVLIYYYDHGGLRLWFRREPQRCGWDEGLFGLMAVHKDKAAMEFGDMSNPENYERAMKRLESEVYCWDLYYTGQVYGYVVEDKDCCHVDSCWGFYDEPDEVMKEAIEIADSEADRREKVEREEAERVAKYEMICEPFWID